MKDQLIGHYKFLEHNIGSVTKPINLQLRNAVIDILEGHNIKDSTKTNITFNIYYNVVPSIIIMIAISIVCLVKKKYIMPLVFGTQLLKSFGIMLTAPDCFFMYYLPTYLTGYFIGILLLITFLYNKKREEKIDILI